jgi:Family of unknown function (DUF5652)
MNSLYNFGQIPASVLFALLIWSLLWKGLALWKAVKNEQRNWYIVMLVANTFGILEIVYLFYFAKKRMKLKELMFWKSK